MSPIDLIAATPAPGRLDWVRSMLDRAEPVAIRHPLGFACLPLAREELDACVHLWTPRLDLAEPTTSAVHCHSWDLTSHVLYGCVRNEVVEVEDDPVAPTHRAFEIRSEGDRDHIVPTERLVRCRSVATTCHSAGETYTLPAGRFHSTVVAAGREAATLVLAVAQPGGIDLSLGGPEREAHTVSRRRYDPTETALAIETISKRLATAHDPRGALP